MHLTDAIRDGRDTGTPGGKPTVLLGELQYLARFVAREVERHMATDRDLRIGSHAARELLFGGRIHETVARPMGGVSYFALDGAVPALERAAADLDAAAAEFAEYVRRSEMEAA